MRYSTIPLTLTLGAVVLLSGCASTTSRPPLYCNDPSYPEAMYLYLQDDPDSAKQMDLMKKYFESAEAKNQKAAPGAYAHMGLLMAKNNDPVAAEKYFAKEKDAFPEFTKYFDFLAKQKASQQGGKQ